MKIKGIKPISTKHIERIPSGAWRTASLRVLRTPLLDAFDIYKSNVHYGIIEETPEEKAAILEWYRALLDLEEWAFKNPPASVLKYRRREV